MLLWDIKELYMKKEELKKKSKLFFNKLKKVIKRILTIVKSFFINLWKKFMSLSLKIRLIIYVWLIVVISLCAFIIFSNASKKFYAKYEKFENNISTRALQYIKENNFYTTKENKLKVNLETLKEHGYVDVTHISDDTCEGISVIYYDDSKEEYVVDTYLNCKKYTSKNYWDYK